MSTVYDEGYLVSGTYCINIHHVPVLCTLLICVIMRCILYKHHMHVLYDYHLVVIDAVDSVIINYH